MIVLRREVLIQNQKGMHARPASQFVKTSAKYKCEIFVEKDGERVNGKSIMGLMMLAAGPGSKLVLLANGDEAEQALGALEALVARKFDEE